MTTLTLFPNGTMVLDPSDTRSVVFDWDADNLAAGVSISGSALWTITTIRPAKAVVSITRALTVATLTTALPHGLVTGQYVSVSGSAQADYNITAAVTVLSTTSFSYTVSGSPTSPATGTITYGGPSLSKDNEAILSGNRKAQVRLNATTAAVGDVYELACKIVTDEVPAQTKERSIRVLIENL